MFKNKSEFKNTILGLILLLGCGFLFEHFIYWVVSHTSQSDRLTYGGISLGLLLTLQTGYKFFQIKNKKSYENGHESGFNRGFNLGLEKSKSENYQKGFEDGYRIGKEEGLSDGESIGFLKGACEMSAKKDRGDKL